MANVLKLLLPFIPTIEFLYLKISSMKKSNTATSLHMWEKTNPVTIIRSGRAFDNVVCKNCGMKGRRIGIGFEFIEVPEKYKNADVELCPKAQPFNLPVTVKVIKCEAHGKQFANLTPGSVHDVVTPPNGYQNDHTGVWVMGVGEPVKLLTREFTPVK